MRRHVVIRTPWGDLVGDLDTAADEKLTAFTMAAAMLKGKVAEWTEVEDPSTWATCALCGHPDFAHQTADPPADVGAGEPGRPCVAPDCECAGLLLP